MYLGDAHGRPEISGLDEHGIGKATESRLGKRIDFRLPNGPVIDNGQTCIPQETLHHVLVHPDRRTQHARSNVGHVGQLEQTLDRPVFSKSPMKDGKNNIDNSPGGRLGRKHNGLAGCQRLLDSIFRRQQCNCVL